LREVPARQAPAPGRCGSGPDSLSERRPKPRAAGPNPHTGSTAAEDLQLLLVQKPDDKLDLLIYDPMPGGSGLLEQMLSRWKELIATARELLAGYAQGCETACYACLKTFRNQTWDLEQPRQPWSPWRTTPPGVRRACEPSESQVRR
jgi:hypothetical protein